MRLTNYQLERADPGQTMLLLALTVCLINMLFAVGVFCMPLSDQGPHITHGWGQVVRIRHLYAVKSGLHLLINEEGQIHGSVDQTSNSLLEISPVGPGSVVIRGAATTRFLCMERDGRLYSSVPTPGDGPPVLLTCDSASEESSPSAASSDKSKKKNACTRTTGIRLPRAGGETRRWSQLWKVLQTRSGRCIKNMLVGQFQYF
ncbi:fibroblast growth factor 19 isoform X3 [Nothobranchius furzeri]|uniref:fibroblast growth factor 19 isoform X3 n=1 Tax=Nothobranchius furzeri TaxID=105023 RepID=UPI002403D0D8|nr:fibroblast growth factor 19 isoform X3 [Nothobranchius furzeri]